jgi:hypothetical protein
VQIESVKMQHHAVVRKVDLFPSCTVIFEHANYIRNFASFMARMKAGKIPFGVLNAQQVPTFLEFLCAIQRALLNLQNQSMVTRSLYSEVLYALSPSESVTLADCRSTSPWPC